MDEWTPRVVEARLRDAVLLQAGKSQTGTLSDPVHISPRRDDRSIGLIGGIGTAGADSLGTDIPSDPTEALSWLDWLEPEEAALVVSRIEGASWKAICWRFGISRPTADRWWRYALGLIAWRLNGHPSAARPSLRSMLRRSWPSRQCETSPGGTRAAGQDKVW
ncbi:DUF6362 family protein [Bauldia litoralis]|uniref:DUF6362 domain-containing protein n=1 Tax=Bauldia litoralis TaxID=665467 RepID=A0A1G6BHY6_9HYPH|nr:DUF6362 family protein [Bauldia litoralis]SDB20230.1 hypothetical protein SAMN02982931_01475 [Bauldia litoralis]